MSAFVDRLGKRFGRLTVIKFHAIIDHRAHWTCLCDCGNQCVVMGQSLAAGKTASCGCLFLESQHRKGRNITHGQSKTRTYKSWAAMKRRCFNKNDHAFNRYAGRGITVCERWMAFENFLADMGECPEGLTLERKDNERGYEPGNCKWATYTEQAGNRRNVRLILIGEETLNMAEIAERTGVKYGTVYYRYVVSPKTLAVAAMTNPRKLEWDMPE